MKPQTGHDGLGKECVKGKLGLRVKFLTTDRRHGLRGFTLVEMLICVGIILLLAALLFPAYNNMVARAQQGGCIGNLRNISSGIASYVADNDGYLPPIANDAAGGDWTKSKWFPEFLDGYVPAKSWNCPAKIPTRIFGMGLDPNNPYMNGVGWHVPTYSYNNFLSGVRLVKASGSQPFGGHQILMCDGLSSLGASYYDPGNSQYVENRHGQKNLCNFLFLDGSVLGADKKDIVYSWNPIWDGWSPGIIPMFVSLKMFQN